LLRSQPRRNDPFEATVSALTFYAIAGERAALTSSHPGSFYVAFLDALHALDGSTLNASSNGNTFMKTAADLSLYLVAGPADCANGDIIATVREAVAGGVTIVQLRDKTASDEEFVALARSSRRCWMAPACHLSSTTAFTWSRLLGAHGIHVGVNDMPAREVRRIVGDSVLIGTSINPSDPATLPDPAFVDHVGIGPVFATSTKPDHDTPIGFDGLARLIAQAKVPAVAIGGIKHAHAAQALEAGAQGLCVVSAIAGAPDPRDAAHRLKAEIEEARK
jgi:thiamine-phosphate pyrophosphorylase